MGRPSHRLVIHTILMTTKRSIKGRYLVTYDRRSYLLQEAGPAKDIEPCFNDIELICPVISRQPKRREDVR